MTTTLAPALRRVAGISWGLGATDEPIGPKGTRAGAGARLRELGFGSVLFNLAQFEPMRAAPWLEAWRDAELTVMVDVPALEGPQADIEQACTDLVDPWIRVGANALRLIATSNFSGEQWSRVSHALKKAYPDVLVTGWTPGLSAQALLSLSNSELDAVYSSLAWWDQRSPWLLDEAERLAEVAPVIATVAPLEVPGVMGLDPRRLVDDGIVLQRLWMASYLGQGVLIDAQRVLDGPLAPALAQLDSGVLAGVGTGRSWMLSGPLATTVSVYREGAGTSLVLHEHEPDALHAALHTMAGRLPGALVVSGQPAHQTGVGSRAISVVTVERRPPVRARHVEAENEDVTVPALIKMGSRSALRDALQADRVVVDRVTPQLDGGRFAVKRIRGRQVEVQATVFTDGHAHLAAALLWRAADESQWHRVAMQPLGNDRWQAHFVPERLGRHYYTVQAWIADGEPTHCTRQSPVFPLQIERLDAEFGSWYELFPRSMGEPGVHGHLRDVLPQLPRIRAMGFGVLYFPPIHPIGHTNRKGRNNALTAQPGDPGSPYAIGADEGGHTAIHPALGTLQDFQALRDAAFDAGLELALDFAIQCSPDHPWLREHPEWFRWREDGTVQYAENPPKRYEDIVNPDFYSTTATARQRMALWRSLRDIVLYWVNQGVRIFRVDNPHTKPLPFWEWMIAEVNRQHPDVVFLSEAFTRPAMMHRLAKLGFSQSYTYFTWRNTKAELTAYLSELSSTDQPDYFRPNFFVNTPDINPYFLQTSGRAGFLIRAALATCASPLWGMYSGFEVCEAQPLPGREEYQDSEKYELKHRDWHAAGNIMAEVARLNAIRRTNPALQIQRGLRFHHVDDDRVLYFSRTSAEQDNIVLVVISLSPHDTVPVRLEIPAWAQSRGYRPGVRVRGLHDDQVRTIPDRMLPVTLTPSQPYALWSVLA